VQQFSRNATTGELSIDNAELIGGALRLHGTSVASSPYAILASDVLLRVNTTAARTLNLPATTANSIGRLIVIKDETGSAQTNNITIVPASGENIDGGAANAPMLVSTARAVVILYAVSGGWQRLVQPD